jgi:cytoskeleton protein RodZ
MAADRTPGDFGSRLRDARERRGLSLRHIANTTKITVAALDALERNDISRLPGGIFTRAFVRSFAVEVGLDPDEAIRDFIAQFPDETVTGRLQTRQADESGHHGSPADPGRPGNPGNPRDPGNGTPGNDADAVSNLAITPAFLAVALSVLVAGAALYFSASGRGLAAPVVAAAIDFVASGYDHVRGFLRERRAMDTSVPSMPPGPPGPPGPPPPAAPVNVSAPAEPRPAEAPRPVAGPGSDVSNTKNARSASSAKNASNTKNATNTDATKAPADTAAPEPGLRSADYPGSVATVPLADTASAELLTVVLYAKRPCWVSATSDGRKTIDRLLQAGERRTIEVRADLVMTAADASAITMTLNGAEARPFGKPGEVVTVRLNPANFREYLPGR